MTTAVWILSLLLVAEFVPAPVNLWTGRNLPLFQRFAGFAPEVATRVFAPVELLGAVLVAFGPTVPAAGLAGAAVLSAGCAVYLVRLAVPGRRDASGIFAFLLFGAWAVALLVLQLLR